MEERKNGNGRARKAASTVKPAQQEGTGDPLGTPDDTGEYVHEGRYTTGPMQGKFAPGHSGNASGRPKGLTVLGQAKKILTEDPERAKLLAEKWLQAVEADPIKGIDTLFERQDGKVTQPVDLAHTLPQLALRDRTSVDPRLPPGVLEIEETKGTEDSKDD